MTGGEGIDGQQDLRQPRLKTPFTRRVPWHLDSIQWSLFAIVFISLVRPAIFIQPLQIDQPCPLKDMDAYLHLIITAICWPSTSVKWWSILQGSQVTIIILLIISLAKACCWAGAEGIKEMFSEQRNILVLVLGRWWPCH